MAPLCQLLCAFDVKVQLPKMLVAASTVIWSGGFFFLDQIDTFDEHAYRTDLKKP
jgi:hypothetical protein